MERYDRIKKEVGFLFPDFSNELVCQYAGKSCDWKDV